VAITVTGVHQDEPTDDVGDGKHTPDAQNIDGDRVDVRAERSGSKKVPGDGRVYHISFTGDDGEGGTCSGTTTIGVAHDSGPKGGPVDGGPLYDSFLP
jgi:hypothetical protein